MVQIIQQQAPTNRQSALMEALGQAAQSVASGYAQGQLTARQEALQASRQKTASDAAIEKQKTQLRAKGLELGVDPESYANEAMGGKPVVIAPEQLATPAQYGKELQGPVQPGQGTLKEILSQAQPAQPAQYAPSVFSQISERKKAKEDLETKQKQTQIASAERGMEKSDLEMKKMISEMDMNPIKRREAEARIAALSAKAKVAGDGKQLTAANVSNFNEGNQIPAMLKDLSAIISSNKESFGPVSGRISALNPYNEKAQTMDASIRSSAQAFGRFMEGGVLRKEDEEKYRKMFPNLSDDSKVAQNKLAIVERLLTQKQTSLMGALEKSGYDVSGIKQDFPDKALPGILGAQSKNTQAAHPKTGMTREEMIAQIRAQQSGTQVGLSK